MNKINKMNVRIVTYRNGKRGIVNYEYNMQSENEKPMALDVLVQAQDTTIPDLAFRYGCRARNCGVCTIDINNKPRVACRARVRDGDMLSPISTLPVLSDLVVRRDGISRQLRGLDNNSKKNELNVEAPDSYHDLTACIECYACLHNCPMHEKNIKNNHKKELIEKEFYEYGNPFSLLKLQRLRLDPLTTEPGKEQALESAINLGLDTCIECPGCKCGVGINLKGLVIKPLLEAAKNKNKKFIK